MPTRPSRQRRPGCLRVSHRPTADSGNQWGDAGDELPANAIPEQNGVAMAMRKVLLPQAPCAYIRRSAYRRRWRRQQLLLLLLAHEEGTARGKGDRPGQVREFAPSPGIGTACVPRKRIQDMVTQPRHTIRDFMDDV